jgi:branched-subunit amino acid permease
VIHQSDSQGGALCVCVGLLYGYVTVELCVGLLYGYVTVELCVGLLYGYVSVELCVGLLYGYVTVELCVGLLYGYVIMEAYCIYNELLLMRVHRPLVQCIVLCRE